MCENADSSLSAPSSRLRRGKGGPVTVSGKMAGRGRAKAGRAPPATKRQRWKKKKSKATPAATAAGAHVSVARILSYGRDGAPSWRDARASRYQIGRDRTVDRYWPTCSQSGVGEKEDAPIRDAAG